MSNRDRISLAAQEAEAARKAREKAAATPKPRAASRTSRSAPSAPASRMRAAWAVCDQTGATVETFAYPKETEARARAEALTDEKGRTHFVKPTKIPAD